MRKAIGLWLMVIVCSSSGQQAALAQSSFMADVIGQTVAGMNSGWPSGCLALDWKEDPAADARFQREAEPALSAYLALAAGKADLAPAYKRRLPGPWAIDDVPTNDIHAISDPWATGSLDSKRSAWCLGAQRSSAMGFGVPMMLMVACSVLTIPS